MIAHKIFVVVDGFLGALRDFRHRPHRFRRVCSRRGLPGQHNGRRAVVDGVCHIRHLRSRRARVLRHRLEHLRRGNDNFARLIALIDHHLLQRRNLAERYFHAEIAARHHDAVALLDNLGQIVYSLAVLNFTDNLDRPAAVVLQEFPKLPHIVRAAHKGSRNKIDLLFNAEQNILLVNRRKVRHRNADIRNVDALMIAHLSAVDYGTDHLRSLDLLHLQRDFPVVDQDARPLGNILRQLIVGQADPRCIPEGLPIRIESEGLPVFQHGGTSLKILQADLRPLGIQQQGNRNVKLCAHPAHAIHSLPLLLVRPVGKVEPRTVHAVHNQFFDHFLIVNRRSQGANNLCSPHFSFPSFYFAALAAFMLTGRFVTPLALRLWHSAVRAARTPSVSRRPRRTSVRPRRCLKLPPYKSIPFLCRFFNMFVDGMTSFFACTP